MPSRAEGLFNLGQSVWLDFIRRGHMETGEFDRLVRDAGVVGVTSNPSIFQQAIGGSDDYDACIEKRMREGLSGDALLEAIVIEDIQMACDRLLDTFNSTGGRYGRVSIEVNPNLAHDTE
jgi:transaldolase